MAEAVETMEGWFSLHDLRSIDWPKWKRTSNKVRQEAIEEFIELIAKWEEVETQKKGSHVLCKALGHKADLMFMFLRPTVEQLSDIETKIEKSKLGDFLIRKHSYLSVVELGKHRAPKDVDLRTSPRIRERLYPILPKWDYMSFYPMNRKREAHANWFTLEQSERSKLLYEHSLTGRKYMEKVRQVTTGSIGLDLWEWAITLFSNDALQLKKIVYEIRFDEASSRFGEFGDFYIGIRMTEEGLKEYLAVSK